MKYKLLIFHDIIISYLLYVECDGNESTYVKKNVLLKKNEDNLKIFMKQNYHRIFFSKSDNFYLKHFSIKYII